jgi:hypothetical protein
MTTIREISIASIAEPASIKIERNSKGYNYEVSLKSENMVTCWNELKEIKKKIEGELYENQPGRDENTVQK